MPPALLIAHIQRAVARHIAHARRTLLDERLDDDAVHAARKDLKRARSGLRLLRPLDEKAYQRENLRLRNAARRLSGVRDHKVLLGRITRLIAGEKKAGQRQLLLDLRKDLYNARRRDWRALRSPKELERIGGVLAQAAKHVRKWPAVTSASGDAAQAPVLALQHLYRKGRNAFARSRKDPSDERLHEARKQAKHLAQALEILAGQQPAKKKTRKALARAGDVGNWLGDDHDLAVVEAHCLALPRDAGKAKRKLRRRLEKRRSRLQAKALDTAQRLFRKKTPKLFVDATS